MINHAAIMLLNKPEAYYAGCANAVYTPVTYRPITVPAGLQPVRDVLLPAYCGPETELALVYRLLTILHTPEFEPYVFAWDARYTYALRQNKGVDLIIPQVTITTVNKTVNCDIVPRYRPVLNTAKISIGESGVFTWKFQTGSSTQTRFTNAKGVNALVALVDGSTGTKSREQQLIENRLYASFDLPSRAFTGGYTITYSTQLIPTYEIPEVMDQLKQVLASQPVGRALFEPFAPVENDMRQLQATYRASTEVTLQFGAAVMAFVYQMGRILLSETAHV